LLVDLFELNLFFTETSNHVCAH